MLKAILTNDLQKLNRQIEALKIELENPKLSNKDRRIFKDTLNKLENQKKLLSN